MTNQGISKWGFFLGLSGALIGLVVGLWAPFVLQLSNKTNFLILSGVAIFVTILLWSLTAFFLFKMRGMIKSIAFLIFFGWLQFAQGMLHFLDSFDDSGLITQLRPYFEYDIFVLMPIFFALGFIPFVYQIFRKSYINIFVKERVLKNGIRAMAQIISISDTNIRINKRRMYDVKLKINTAQFGTYSKELLLPISPLNTELFKIGQSIEVAIDLNNKNRLFVV